MAVIDSRGFNLVPDISPFSGAASSFISQKISERLQKRALEGDDQALTRLSTRDPQAAQAVGSIFDTRRADTERQRQQDEQRQAQLNSVAGNVAQGFQSATDKKGFLQAAVGQLQAQFPEMAAEIQDDVDRYDANPESVLQEYTAALSLFSQQGQQRPTAAIEERDRLLKDLNSPDENVRKSAEIKLRLTAGAVGSSDQTITDKKSAEEIAETKRILVAGTEAGKLEQQLKFRPQIQKAVKLAEEEARERGEVLTDLSRSKAALPGLMAAVAELKELAVIATSTFGGKIFDSAVKQSGFGSTKGATARAKFIAIINNQVLPLLKPTFGGSFSIQEGESLKATMGDPDSTIDEKLAQLNSFIDQRVRDMETKQRQLDQAPQQAAPTQQREGGQIMVDAQGNRAMVFPDGTFEELR